MDMTGNSILSNVALFRDVDDKRQQALYEMAFPSDGKSSRKFYRLLNSIRDERLKLALEAAVFDMISEAIEVAHDAGVSATIERGNLDYIEIIDKIFAPM